MSPVSLLPLPVSSVCQPRRRTSRPQLRRTLWEKHRHCFYCGRYMRRSAARLDHILPLSRGGADEIYNLILSCKHCDQAKTNKRPIELFWWSTRILILSIVARVRQIGGAR